MIVTIPDVLSSRQRDLQTTVEVRQDAHLH